MHTWSLMISNIFVSRLPKWACLSQKRWVVCCKSAISKQHLVRCTTRSVFFLRSLLCENDGVLFPHECMTCWMLRHFLFFSLRLTAYVVKVFAMASNLVPIESHVICSAVRFLITQTQNSDSGSFREVGRVYSSGMNVRKDSIDIRSEQNALYHNDTVFCFVINAPHSGTCRATWKGETQTPPWQPSASLPCRSPAPYVIAQSEWVAMKNLSHLNAEINKKKNWVVAANGQKICITASFSRVLVQDLSDRIKRAVNFLEVRLPSLTYSYAIAMTSYALANENKLNRNRLFQYISPGNVYASI